MTIVDYFVLWTIGAVAFGGIAGWFLRTHWAKRASALVLADINRELDERSQVHGDVPHIPFRGSVR